MKNHIRKRAYRALVSNIFERLVLLRMFACARKSPNPSRWKTLR
jgi:hypothetical protein